MTATLIPERLALLPALHLIVGHGDTPNGAVAGCAMDVASWLAGEPWSDHPECVSGVIGAFVRSWNDTLNDADRDRLLLPLVPRLVGTADGKAIEERRAWMACDWLVRMFTPTWLRLAKLNEHAAALEALPEQTSVELAWATLPIINAGGDAAGDAARAAARAAAWDAARAAARAAAGDAAWAAAGAAAWAAAWDAARAAAGDALAPTVAILQDSASELLNRMIDVHREVTA